MEYCPGVKEGEWKSGVSEEKAVCAINLDDCPITYLRFHTQDELNDLSLDPNFNEVKLNKIPFKNGDPDSDADSFLVWSKDYDGTPITTTLIETSDGVCMNPEESAQENVLVNYLEFENLDRMRDPQRFTELIWGDYWPNQYGIWWATGGCTADPL